jgi:hypothetical protein
MYILERKEAKYELGARNNQVKKARQTMQYFELGCVVCSREKQFKMVIDYLPITANIRQEGNTLSEQFCQLLGSMAASVKADQFH